MSRRHFISVLHLCATQETTCRCGCLRCPRFSMFTPSTHLFSSSGWNHLKFWIWLCQQFSCVEESQYVQSPQEIALHSKMKWSDSGWPDGVNIEELWQWWCCPVPHLQIIFPMQCCSSCTDSLQHMVIGRFGVFVSEAPEEGGLRSVLSRLCSLHALWSLSKHISTLYQGKLRPHPQLSTPDSVSQLWKTPRP